MVRAKSMGTLLLAALTVGLLGLPTAAQDAPAGGETPRPAPVEPPTAPARPQVQWTEIKGVVVGADGAPVAGAVVAPSIVITNGKPGVARGEPMTTGEDGSFTTRMVRGRAGPLVAYSADGEMAGWMMVTAEGESTSVKLALGPTGTIKGCMKLPEGMGSIENGSVTIAARVEGLARGPMLVSAGTTGEFTIRVPVGEFNFTANPGTPKDMPAGMWQYDFTGGSKVINVKAGEEADAGEIMIGISAAGQLIGKVMPEWKVTESRNAPAGDQIADYKGKWVLLEFWGFW